MSKDKENEDTSTILAKFGMASSPRDSSKFNSVEGSQRTSISGPNKE